MNSRHAMARSSKDVRTAVVLLAHGSSLCGAADALRRHARAIRERGEFDVVEAAFLNINHPTFDVSVERCLESGAERVVVLPYFLVSGRFVQIEFSGRVTGARARWPGVDFRAAGSLGFSEQLATAVVETAMHGCAPAIRRLQMLPSLEQCEKREDCPLYVRGACPTRDSMPADAVPHQAEASENSFLAALLIVAHGSPRSESVADIRRVTESVRRSDLFADTCLAFLGHGDPDIPGAIRQFVEKGFRHIIVVPYFLHAGGHVVIDVPEILMSAQTEHPGVQFLLGDYIGNSPRLTDVLIERVREALTV